MIQDCSRPPDTDWDIGRGSEVSRFCSFIYLTVLLSNLCFVANKVNFMDMNLKTMRYDAKPGDARPVVFQFSKDSPMEPRTL